MCPTKTDQPSSNTNPTDPQQADPDKQKIGWLRRKLNDIKEKRQENPKQAEEGTIALQSLRTFVVGGIIIVLIFALCEEGSSRVCRTLSIGLLIASASLTIGGLLGFLFGIPRTLQQDSDSKDSTEYRANTNLEQISDWLTKMLVGIGLIQMHKISGILKNVTQYIADGLGTSSYYQPFVLLAILSFVIIGFFVGFLWARLFLPRAFRVADLVSKVAELQGQINKPIEQQKAAMELVHRQLDIKQAEVDAEELYQAINKTHKFTKINIFNLAWQIRSENWRDAATKPLMERTIPIFQGLIKTDKEGQYHKNHGQLGFAYKDKIKPDYRLAEQELSKAIEIREHWQDYGWLFYEFNRAICRIELDQNFARNQAADPETKKNICRDLTQAATTENLRDYISTNPKIKQWLSLNKVKIPKVRI